MGQTESAGGRLVETKVWLGNFEATYAIWARSQDGSQSFKHCWGATQDLIEQCIRSGQSAGTWEYDSEFYTMTAASGVEYGRRDDFSVTDLPALPSTSSGSLKDITLENGTYNILGVPVQIAISGIDLGPLRHAPRSAAPSVLYTNDGNEVSNFTVIAQPKVDLAAVVQEGVSELLGQHVNATTGHNSLSRRRQTCKTNKKYAMVEYGAFAGPVIPYSLHVGRDSHGEVGTAITITESFSIGIDAGIANTIAGAALSMGYSWERSHTVSNLLVCAWTTGSCHVLSLSQPMAYQRGFILEFKVDRSWNWYYKPLVHVDIKLIRSESPSGETAVLCGLSCCSPRNLEKFGSYWNMCQYAGDKKCFYGTCENWEDDCNGIGQIC